MARADLRRQRGRVARATLILWAFGMACVLVPALFFWGTWYGVRLDDARLAEFLEPGESADHARHAVEEIVHRYEEGAPNMERWAPSLLDLTRRDDPSLRLAAAWAMGEDAGRPDFAQRLEELLADPVQVVRCNAALSLARGGSVAGRPVLRAMLEPFEVRAGASGVVETLASPGERVEAGRPVARLDLGEGATGDVRSPLPGTVRSAPVATGDAVRAEDVLLVVGPDADYVLNAVTALGRIGDAEDLPALSALADPRSGMPETVQTRAAAAAAAIRAR